MIGLMLNLIWIVLLIYGYIRIFKRETVVCIIVSVFLLMSGLSVAEDHILFIIGLDKPILFSGPDILNTIGFNTLTLLSYIGSSVYMIIHGYLYHVKNMDKTEVMWLAVCISVSLTIVLLPVMMIVNMNILLWID